MKIVLELPDDCNPGFPEALKDLANLVRRAAGKRGRHGDFAEVEMEFAKAAGRVEAEAVGVVLASLDVDAPFIRVDGQRYKNLGPQPKTYSTLAGKVTIVRCLFRADDVRNGPTVDPVALRVGMVGDGWLPGAAKAIAHGLAMATSREAAAQAAQTGRLPYSRSTFERVGHIVGESYCARNLEIEDALASQLTVPNDAFSVSVSLDRAAVPMEEIAQNGEDVVRAFRMAHCATITLHDDEGEALHTIRYGRMPRGDVAGLDDTLRGDLATVLAQRPDLEVVLLADGATELWTRLDALTKGLVKRPVRLVDFWHVCEYLSKAAHAMLGPQLAIPKLKRWKELLLTSKSAWPVIKAELRPHQHREEVDAALTYVDNRDGMLDYASARSKGLPIGSGNVEATCKNLVGLRFKRSGARWKEDSGDRVIQLRALQLSDCWDAGIAEALKPHRREVRRLAA